MLLNKELTIFREQLTDPDANFTEGELRAKLQTVFTEPVSDYLNRGLTVLAH